MVEPATRQQHLEEVNTAGRNDNKRARLCRQHEQQQQQDHRRYSHHHQHRQHGGDEEDGMGCLCSNAGCPWQWGGIRRSSNRRSQVQSTSTSPAAATAAAARTTTSTTTRPAAEAYDSDSSDGSDSEKNDSLQPPQLFDGPLLSVKEYRDRLTGEVRWVCMHLVFYDTGVISYNRVSELQPFLLI